MNETPVVTQGDGPNVASPTSTATPASDRADLRPENIQDSLTLSNPDPNRTAEVNVEVTEPMGAETYLYLNTGASSFIARVRPTDRFEVNQRVRVTFDLDHAHLFDPSTEASL